MKKGTTVFCALSFLTCLLLSSCNSGGWIRPVSSLMSPPLYYEEYEELVEAFNEKAGEGATLCAPSGGEYSSAIILKDLNGDGEKEALIFYRSAAEETTARISCFYLFNEKWISGWDLGGYGDGVESATLVDMDADGNFEIIVKWSVSGVASGNVASVYRTAGSPAAYKEILNETCAVCEVLDVVGDGKRELFFITVGEASGIMQRTAKVMRISNDSVVLMGETKVDPNVSAYVSVKTEKAAEDSPLKIYVDALKGESQMITELIYWDSERLLLCAPLLDEETVSNSATLRYEPIACADINNDGVIDVPVQTARLAGGDDAATAVNEAVYLTRWKDFDANGETAVANTVINREDGYMIYLDEDETRSTGIRNYRSQNCWVVYTADADGKSMGELYSVIKIPPDRWNDADFDAYIPIIRGEDGTVCVYVTQTGEERGIDEEYIKAKITGLP